MPLRLIALLLVGLCTGVATAPLRPALADEAPTPATAPAAGGTQAPVADAPPDPTPDPTPVPSAAPAAELTADLVYAVLVGELGTQRGDHAMAFTHFLHAARLSRDASLAEEAVRAALAREDNAAARRAASLLIELAPASQKAYELSAYLYIVAGDRQRALADLNRVLDLARTPGQGFMQAMRLLATLPEPVARVDYMRDLIAGHPEDADAHFALATLAAAAEDNATAREYAERAAQLRPGWNAPRLFLVRLLLGGDDAAEAAPVLDRFLADTPGDQELLMLRAQLHIDAEEYPAALAVLDRVLTAGPGQPDALFVAAVVALEAKQTDAARRYLDALVKTGKRAGDAAFLLGQVEEDAENTELALDWYDKVRGDNESSAQVRVAGIYARRGDMARAREVMQSLRVQYPEDAVTLYLIEGELLRTNEQRQQAIDLYSTALVANPDEPELLYARAMAAVTIDRVDVLEADLRRILQRDPDHVDALNALGYTLADRTDRYEEAFRLIQRALQLRPDEPAIQDSMGWVLYRKGDLAGAERWLRQALDQVFDAEIAAHLGEVLWEQGRQDEARTVWRRALDEAPDHEYLLRVLGRYRITANER